MGQSSSSRRRRTRSNSEYYNHPPYYPQHSQPLFSPSNPSFFPAFSPLLPSNSFSAYYSHSQPQFQPQPAQHLYFTSNYAYRPNSSLGSSRFRLPQPSSSSSPSLPPRIEPQKVTIVRNDVNLHKDSIRLVADELNPDSHLVSFTFDALVDGRITIYYFAKQEANCSILLHYPDNYLPVRVPFQKGLSQEFHQPSGTGIDLGFFVLEDLSKPTLDDVYPLVICAEACTHPLPADEQILQPLPTANAQITEAVIEKQNDELFHIKIIRQVLWVDGIRYELQELFGIENSAEPEFNHNDSGKECVICLSKRKDTAVLPCRHLCMCSECAKVLTFQSNKCPICRQPVGKLIMINI